MRIREIACVALMAGCGDVVTEPGGPGPMPDPNDTTSPRVVSTTPSASATGVGADTKLVIQFDEPMDPATVEAAYSSADLPLEQISLNFNADQTELTITPVKPLVYAEGMGTDPSAIPAKTYSIAISQAATDLAGNPLDAPLALSFATKRRMTASFPLDSTLTRVALGGTLLASSNDIWVGDNAVDNTYRAYITFDMTAMPANIDVESAQFSSRQLPPVGAPYNLGAVMAHHVSFATLNGFGSMQAISIPGMYSQDGNVESKIIDVTPQVADDLAHRTERNSRTQYRLQIDTATNANAVTDRAVFAKDTFQLTAVYVAD